MNEQDTLKTSLISEAAMMMARIYKQHLHPMKYERIFYLDGIRVKVTIEEHKSGQDTQPMTRVE
jgi:hypothetical protein